MFVASFFGRRLLAATKPVVCAPSVVRAASYKAGTGFSSKSADSTGKQGSSPNSADSTGKKAKSVPWKPRNPLEEFFEPGDGQRTIHGRPWRVYELRLKSWSDLHKLWYVCLKEKNMLQTQRQMLIILKIRWTNGLRLAKVRKTMARIKIVLTLRMLKDPSPRRRFKLKHMINDL